MRFLNRKFVWVILSLFVFAFQINAQGKANGKPVPEVDGEQAYQMLLKIDLFALGGTGVAGVTSKGEKALNILLKENEPVPALRKLAKEADYEGRLYALLGLKILNCECFKEELENLKKLPAPPARRVFYGEIEQGNVKRMSGCIVFQESWLEVLNNIENEKDEIKWKLDSWKKRQQ